MPSSTIIILPLAFMGAALFAVYGTPFAIAAAKKYAIVDKPDNKLKTHKEPIAYLGGMVIYLSLAMTLALTTEFTPEIQGMILAGTIIVLLGLIDDFGVLPAKVKFTGQLFATFMLVKSGIMFKLTFLPVYLSIPLTFVWIIGMTNAMNIIDVMDGLASGVAFVAGLVFGVVALINGRMQIALLAFALSGSLLGFLRYNFVPARIYLGDAGSMFLGMMLGSLGMIGSYSDVNPIGYFAPAFILGVPIFDTLFVMVHRVTKGMSPFRGSPDHYALRLMKSGWSVRKIVLSTCFVMVTLGGFSLTYIHISNRTSALILLLSSIPVTLVTWIYFSRLKPPEGYPLRTDSQ